MHSPRLYKYRYSYIQFTPPVRYNLHTLFWYRHTYMTFPAPACARSLYTYKTERKCEIYGTLTCTTF